MQNRLVPWLGIQVLLLLPAVASGGGGERCRERARVAGASFAGAAAPSVAQLASPADLVVSGQVLRPDGKTPAAGVVLYVYQTGRDGRYAALPGAAPRLRAWLRTDAQGRYEYRTIRPGPYPGGREPAHVHTQLWGDGVPVQWGTTLVFADDLRVSAAQRRESAALGRFGFVCAPQPLAGGTVRCRHDLRLSERGDRLEPSTRHGLSGPPARATGAGG